MRCTSCPCRVKDTMSKLAVALLRASGATPGGGNTIVGPVSRRHASMHAVELSPTLLDGDAECRARCSRSRADRCCRSAACTMAQRPVKRTTCECHASRVPRGTCAEHRRKHRPAADVGADERAPDITLETNHASLARRRLGGCGMRRVRDGAFVDVIMRKIPDRHGESRSKVEFGRNGYSVWPIPRRNENPWSVRAFDLSYIRSVIKINFKLLRAEARGIIGFQ